MSETQTKKIPTWATIVGILGIIFASLGILGAGQTMMMSKIIEFQKQTFSRIYEMTYQRNPVY